MAAAPITPVLAAQPTPVTTPITATPAAVLAATDVEFKKQLERAEARMKQVNKIAEQLEKEKYMIRRALLTGKFDEINREKALVYAKQWDRGIQFIPLKAEDWVGLPGDLKQEEEDENSIFKKVDMAMTARRQWIHARPPSLFPSQVPRSYPLNYQNQVASSNSTPWLPINQQNPLEQRAIADWRVMPVMENQPIYSLNL